VASENDAIIPPSVSEGYINIATKANDKRLLIIKDATHAFAEPLWKETFTQATLDWFSKTIAK